MGFILKKIKTFNEEKRSKFCYAVIVAVAMVSDPPMDRDVMVQEPVVGSIPNNKKQMKVPKKIHKAEREKQKRDQLNELFLALGYALEPTRQNTCKASILGDATRLLRDLILQVESLRKENITLVTESRYVTAEKEELKDEKTTIEADITRLHNELQERLQSDMMTQAPVPPIYMVPHPQQLNPSPPKPPTQVMRPHARYLSDSDSWPLQILSRNQNNGSGSNSEDS